jgi:hypothetical protein
MADPAVLTRIVNRIQSIPELKGCRIGFQGVYGIGGPVSKSLFGGNAPSVNCNWRERPT